MFKKGTKLYSIYNNKCPRCHEGDFFIVHSLFKFKNLLKLHTNCNHCNLKYMIEPSFFYGAMYISYGITVALSVIVFVVSNVFIGLNPFQSFFAIIGVLVLLTPFNMRLSRIIWINMFVKYKKDS